MIEELLKVGSLFDWITPLVAIIQRIINAPVSDFGIPAYSGLGTGTIRRLLKYNGIRVWGVMYDFDGDVLMFTVRWEEAEDVYHILRSECIPILYSPIVDDF